MTRRSRRQKKISRREALSKPFKVGISLAIFPVIYGGWKAWLHYTAPAPEEPLNQPDPKDFSSFREFLFAVEADAPGVTQTHIDKANNHLDKIIANGTKHIAATGAATSYQKLAALQQVEQAYGIAYGKVDRAFAPTIADTLIRIDCKYDLFHTIMMAEPNGVALWGVALTNHALAAVIENKAIAGYWECTGGMKSTVDDYVNSCFGGQRSLAEEVIALCAEHDAHSIVYTVRGDLFYDQKEFAKAAQDYTKAIELSPRNAAAFCNRGNAYKQLGRYKEALDDHNKSIRLAPRDPKSYQNRAALLQTLSKIAEKEGDPQGKEFYQKAAREDIRQMERFTYD